MCNTFIFLPRGTEAKSKEKRREAMKRGQGSETTGWETGAWVAEMVEEF